MSKTLKFKTYCIEAYKCAKGMSGRDVQILFEQYSVLQYIYEFYELLHSTSESYIIEDIDIYIEARKSVY